MTTVNKQGGGYGQQRPADSASAVGIDIFEIQRMLNRVRTIEIVQVMAVNSDPAVMTVDVQVLVNQTDGVGTAKPHSTMHNIPYWQWQFGISAIKAAPVVKDKGILLVCDRDISSVVANRAKTGADAPANPGSFRQFDLADGLYIGGILNGAATQYIEMDPTNGIRLVSPIKVAISAPEIDFN